MKILAILVTSFCLTALGVFVFAQGSPENLDDFVMEDPSQPSPDEIQGGAQQLPPTVPTATTSENALLEGFFEDINYSPEDKRDPFLPFLSLNKIKRYEKFKVYNYLLFSLQLFVFTRWGWSL